MECPICGGFVDGRTKEWKILGAHRSCVEEQIYQHYNDSVNSLWFLVEQGDFTVQEAEERQKELDEDLERRLQELNF